MRDKYRSILGLVFIWSGHIRKELMRRLLRDLRHLRNSLKSLKRVKVVNDWKRVSTNMWYILHSDNDTAIYTGTSTVVYLQLRSQIEDTVFTQVNMAVADYIWEGVS